MRTPRHLKSPVVLAALLSSAAVDTSKRAPRASLRDAIAGYTPLVHAFFLGIGGLWSVVGRRSFEKVSGPKVDYWLVRTVGGLLTVIGAVVGIAAVRGRITPEIRSLAIGTDCVLIAIDLIYVAKRRIRPIYLLDAAANSLAIAGWLLWGSTVGASDQARPGPGSA
jgi:hypothetical protein